MQTAKKIRNLGIRATAQRQKQLKQIALDRGLSVQGLIEEALEAYVDADMPRDEDEARSLRCSESSAV